MRLGADIANSTVKFDEKGDGLARYTIFNYQKKLEGAGYDYKVRMDKAQGAGFDYKLRLH